MDDAALIEVYLMGFQSGAATAYASLTNLHPLNDAEGSAYGRGIANVLLRDMERPGRREAIVEALRRSLANEPPADEVRTV